ncbi:5'-deoxynucleotidase [Alteromonas sp. 1_MG-2023]|uniref:5'-deoxynucleotidase n=1 Tax=Alteromonas sp. 1_MG-2023 TaxID=3062669 RepID=UPI0026E42AB6|nr:5'-deoxynucleotidase [Alteromonas sp. 1_MG-2023]MDO6476946.1 5'-deoxynucleotidase [Alteromonas sp. 1_MG-2023]
MSKQSTFLAWILRMPLIKRWSLMHTVKGENIAEHSHQVAVIAHLLAVIRKEHFGGTLSPERAATIALYHEVSETKLSDINHVTKYHNPRITREFKKLEDASEKECVSSLPLALQKHFSDLVVQASVDPEYKTLVKAADLISAWLKACDEIAFGNREFIPVRDRLDGMLAHFKEKLPEVRYLFDTFTDNCLVSVDELSQQDI